jgi:hypothetical protein
MSSTLAGCGSSLIYAHDTSLGVDVSVRPDEMTGRILIGYDRDTYALIPNKGKQNGGTEEEAMSLASVSCFDVEGLSRFHYNQFIATGSSAKTISKDEEAVKQIKKAIYGGEQQCIANNQK